LETRSHKDEGPKSKVHGEPQPSLKQNLMQTLCSHEFISSYCNTQCPCLH